MIALAPLSDIYWMISTEFPGLNETSAIDWLRWAAHKLCSETNASQDTIESSIGANDPILSYESPSTQVLVHRVMSVQAPRREIAIKSMENLATENRDWRAMTGQPVACTPEAPGEMRLVPIPVDAETGIILRVALVPTWTALKIDRDILNRYADAISLGARGQILSMAGQRWSDPVQGVRFTSLFHTAIGRIKPIGAMNNAYTEERPAIRRQF